MKGVHSTLFVCFVHEKYWNICAPSLEKFGRLETNCCSSKVLLILIQLVLRSKITYWRILMVKQLWKGQPNVHKHVFVGRIPPSMNMWKLNTNATCILIRKWDGLEWLLRDHMGRVRLASFKIIPRCNEIKVLEAIDWQVFSLSMLTIYWWSLIVWRSATLES